MSLLPSDNPDPDHSQRVIRLLVVDDHPLLRDGIAALVNGQLDMELVAQASNGREGIEEFRQYAPDVTAGE